MVTTEHLRVDARIHVNEDAQVVLEFYPVKYAGGEIAFGPMALTRAQSLHLAEWVLKARAAADNPAPVEQP